MDRWTDDDRIGSRLTRSVICVPSWRTNSFSRHYLAVRTRLRRRKKERELKNDTYAQPVSIIRCTIISGRSTNYTPTFFNRGNTRRIGERKRGTQRVHEFQDCFKNRVVLVTTSIALLTNTLLPKRCRTG